MSEVLTSGHCLCGQVTYTITGQPVRMAQCHCKDCQRATGSGHASIAFFKEEQLSIQGKTADYAVTADSGNSNNRIFCPTCGSRLFSTNSGRPGIIGVIIGCADQHDWFSPAAVVYCKDRPVWDFTRTDIPNFDAMPPPA